MDQKLLTERLIFIFENTNNWMKFAEAKNGALLILNSGLIFGFLGILPNTIFDCPPLILLYSGSFMLFCLLSLIMNLFSFLPFFNTYDINPSKINENLIPNVIFWGDLSKINSEELIKRLSDQKNESILLDQYQKDLSSQIIINSAITQKKYNLFRHSIWLTIFGIITPILGIVFLLIYNSIKGAKHGISTNS